MAYNYQYLTVDWQVVTINKLIWQILLTACRGKSDRPCKTETDDKIGNAG